MVRTFFLAALLGSACSTGSTVPDGAAASDQSNSGDGPTVGDTATTGDRPLEARLALADGRPATKLVEVVSFGTNPGHLRMYKIVPPGLTGPAPLLVVLHGCQLTASTFEAASGWIGLGLSRRFLLVYAEQSTGNNPEACFNWFRPELSGRGQGEASSIRQMVEQMRADHAVDPTRIFVTGLSAGAAMAGNLLADYPDVFAAGAIMSGVPTGCASSAIQALSCMQGVDRTPAAWGDLARTALPGYSGARPRVVLFHGTIDPLVAYSNLGELVEQWTNVHGTDASPDAKLTVKGQPVEIYRTVGGVEVVRAYSLVGMGHGVAVDPGAGPEQGGVAGPSSFDLGFWSSYFAAQFFGL